MILEPRKIKSATVSTVFPSICHEVMGHLNVYTHILFIHSFSMDICFPFGLLWIMLLWRWVYRYLFETQLSILLGSHQKWNCWIMWSYGNSMFNFLRNCPNFFYSDWTILHSHWQCMRVLISLCPCSHLVFYVFIFLNSHLMGIEWNLIVVLIHISLISNDDEILFMCLLAICLSSL